MWHRLLLMWRKRKEKGSILVVTAIMLPVLLAFTGIAFDIGRLYVEKSRFQNMADAAVLAGMSELRKHPFFIQNSGKIVPSIPIGALPYEFPLEHRELRVNADAKANDYLMKNSGNDEFFLLENNGAKSELYFLRDAVMGDADSHVYYYEVIIEKTFPLTFGRIVYGKDIPVRAGAVSVFSLRDEESIYTYEYALQNWSRLSLEDLYKIDSSRRLKVDRQALTYLAHILLGKDRTWLNANLGTDANGNKTLFGHYTETVKDGELSTSYKPYSSTQGKTLGDKFIGYLQNNETGSFSYDTTQRYLFSDYATSHEDGFKLTYTKDASGLVNSVTIYINPADTSNGSGALTVTVP